MLKTIQCDIENDGIIKRRFVSFKRGLNIICSKINTASDIQEGVLLTLIDFVFGGSNYLLAAKPESNLPNVIYFEFVFDDMPYYFLRTTNEYAFIGVCNKDFHLIETWHLKDYLSFLSEKYGLSNNGNNFREMITPYIVLPRDLCHKEIDDLQRIDEKEKLPEEKLIYLFNKSQSIELAEQAYTRAENEYKTFTDAYKYGFIPFIPFSDENEAAEFQTDILELKQQAEDIVRTTSLAFDDEYLYKNRLITRDHYQILELQKEKIRLELENENLDSHLNSLDQKHNESNGNYDELIKIFPKINQKYLDQVDNFHRAITKSLEHEIAEQREKNNTVIAYLTDEAEKIKGEINANSASPFITAEILQKYADLDREIRESEAAFGQYTRWSQLKNKIDFHEKKRKSAIKQELTGIKKTINNQMDLLNQAITDVSLSISELCDILTGRKEAPKQYQKDDILSLISFDNNNIWNESYPDIIDFLEYRAKSDKVPAKLKVFFDLAVLKESALPFVIHDSSLFTDFSEAEMGKLLCFYQFQTGKQKFITVDENKHQTAHDLLNKSTGKLIL
ncbi:MAG: hypothetical protein IJI41_12515 [Anaerolineaceae bacterium]|nr:hypothetical protein [Anaerolineaceae bacterium]